MKRQYQPSKTAGSVNMVSCAQQDKRGAPPSPAPSRGRKTPVDLMIRPSPFSLVARCASSTGAILRGCEQGGRMVLGCLVLSGCNFLLVRRSAQRRFASSKIGGAVVRTRQAVVAQSFRLHQRNWPACWIWFSWRGSPIGEETAPSWNRIMAVLRAPVWTETASGFSEPSPAHTILIVGLYRLTPSPAKTFVFGETGRCRCRVVRFKRAGGGETQYGEVEADGLYRSGLASAIRRVDAVTTRAA